MNAHQDAQSAETADMRETTQDDRDRAATAILRAEGWLDADETAEPQTWDECRYEVGRSEWLILTDDEADSRCADYIEETLWAFNADFLAGYMPDGIDADEVDAIRGDRCEDANQAMLALVNAGPPGNLQQLIADAISADGRGHFLAGYDGDENEHTIEGRTWYAYRT